MQTSKELNSDKLIIFIASFLKQLHEIDDINWENFFSPFLYAFMDYLKISDRESNELQEIDDINIPYGNNDFLMSLERKEYCYALIKSRRLSKNKKIKISTLSSEYIKNYIFPYSDKSKIAFFSFPNKAEKVIYYLISLFEIKSCKFDWYKQKSNLVFTSKREELICELKNEFGEDNEDIFELLVFLIPSIYIENFIFYYEKAKNEAIKINKVKTIFFIRHFIYNPTFLILLCLESQKNKKLITYQHGGVYGQSEPTWSEQVEKKICTDFLTWGYKYDKKDVSFFSLRFKRSIISNINKILLKKNKKGILIVLPLLVHDNIYKAVKNFFYIYNSIKKNENEGLFIRFDPREKDNEFVIKILEELKIVYYIDNSIDSLIKVADKYKTIVFTTPNGTGYLELINESFYPIMIFHEKDYNIKKESLEIYYKMKYNNVWIDYDNIESADLNTVNSEQKLIIKEFKKRFARTSFFPAIRLNYLLIKSVGNEK